MHQQLKVSFLLDSRHTPPHYMIRRTCANLHLSLAPYFHTPVLECFDHLVRYARQDCLASDAVEGVGEFERKVDREERRALIFRISLCLSVGIGQAAHGNRRTGCRCCRVW